MKIIHQNGFTRDELLSYRNIIYKNLVDSAQAIILQMRKLQVDCEVPANRVRTSSTIDTENISRLTLALQANTEKILQCQIGQSSSYTIPQEIAEAINRLWRDPAITPIMDSHSSDFYLMDSAS
jgi:guanine nucleotide-binding protein G(i) subunit alpha